jgi:hypothetical protein
MASVLITVRLPGDASLESAMRDLGLNEDEVDTGYGLVPVDPDKELYALRVTESAGRRVGDGSSGGSSDRNLDGASDGNSDGDLRGGGKADGQGPYADPRIEPYGPQR